MELVNVVNTAFILFVLGHLGVTIWWASKVNTVLKQVVRDLDSLVIEIKTMTEIYYRRDEAKKDLALQSKQNDAIWRKIESLLNKI